MHATATITEHDGYTSIRVTDDLGQVILERGALTAVIALTRVVVDISPKNDGEPFVLDIEWSRP